MNTPAHALVNLVLLTRRDGSLGGTGGSTAGRGGAGGAPTPAREEARGADGPVPGRGTGPEAWTVAALLAGGVVPDLPMFVFYGWERLVRGATEAEIWGVLYFDPGWQAVFDLFNSLPLIALGLYVAWRLRSLTSTGLFASMGLHVLADLPLHGADAHRPFFPLSTWRFKSPVSYWDPGSFGGVVAPLELAAVAVCTVVALRRFESRGVRWMVGLTAAAYGGQWIWAAVVWG